MGIRVAHLGNETRQLLFISPVPVLVFECVACLHGMLSDCSSQLYPTMSYVAWDVLLLSALSRQLYTCRITDKHGGSSSHWPIILHRSRFKPSNDVLGLDHQLLLAYRPALASVAE